jgi:hypothetical protein
LTTELGRGVAALPLGVLHKIQGSAAAGPLNGFAASQSAVAAAKAVNSQSGDARVGECDHHDAAAAVELAIAGGVN